MRLRPIRTNKKDERIIEKEILLFLEEEIFSKIIKVFKQENDILNNSKSQIITRLSRNQIEFYAGKFKGKFNASISSTFRKLGANFNRVDNSFSFPENLQIPSDIQLAIARQQTNADILNDTVLRKIDDIIVDIDKLNFTESYDNVIKTIDKKFKNNISIANINFNDLLPEAKEAIAKEWSNNLELFVKKFTDEQIIELRSFTQQNATAGFRASNLEDELQRSFNVSKNKARFLARQETSLFTSNYTKQRYLTSGIDTYTWSTSQDERVREDHQILNGKSFSFEDPPIVDRRTGRKANPGEDYGCRCVAIPVI